MNLEELKEEFKNNPTSAENIEINSNEDLLLFIIKEGYKNLFPDTTQEHLEAIKIISKDKKRVYEYFDIEVPVELRSNFKHIKKLIKYFCKTINTTYAELIKEEKQ